MVESLKVVADGGGIVEGLGMRGGWLDFMTMISVTADSAMAVTAKVSLWKGDVGAYIGEEDLIAIKKLMKGC